MALHFLPKLKSSGTGDLLDEKTAAERLKISSFTLARLRKAGEIAHVRIGGKVRYPASAIPAYIESKTVQPCPTTNGSKSATTTSPVTPTALFGKPVGTTGTPDKHGAHLSAQKIFGKPKSV